MQHEAWADLLRWQGLPCCHLPVLPCTVHWVRTTAACLLHPLWTAEVARWLRLQRPAGHIPRMCLITPECCRRTVVGCCLCRAAAGASRVLNLHTANLAVQQLGSEPWSWSWSWWPSVTPVAVCAGLLLVYARLVDLARGTRVLGGYFLPLSTGYGVGLLLTFSALYLHVGGDQVASPLASWGARGCRQLSRRCVEDIVLGQQQPGTECTQPCAVCPTSLGCKPRLMQPPRARDALASRAHRDGGCRCAASMSL